MEFWQIFGIVGLVALILEIVIPSAFFLNFAVAGFLTTIVSIWVCSMQALIIVFVVLSMLSIIFIRPLLLKSRQADKKSEEIENMYIGKTAKVVEPVTKSSGTVTIFEERWDARLNSEDDEEIPAGSEVKIVKSESLLLYVEKI